MSTLRLNKMRGIFTWFFFFVLLLISRARLCKFDSPSNANDDQEFVVEEEDCVFPVPNTTSDVITLNSENFNEILKSNRWLLLNLYDKTCSHSINFLPTFAQLAKEQLVPLAQVDCNEHKEIAKMFDVAFWPTVVLIYKEEPLWVYLGEKNIQDMSFWLERMIGPPVMFSDSLSSVFEEVEGLNLSALFIATVSSETSSFAKAFKSAAHKHRRFGLFFSIKSEGADVVSVYRKKSNLDSIGETPSNSEKDASKLEQFIMDESVAEFERIEKANFEVYAFNKYDIVWFVISRAQYNSIHDKMLNAAKHYRSKIRFVWLDTDEHADNIGKVIGTRVTIGHPSVVYKKQETNLLFKYPNITTDSNVLSIDSDKVIKFIDDCENGKVRRLFISQSKPTNEETKHVKTIVSQTFEDEVLGAEKDVILNVYAPWCSYCKQMDPTFTKLGELLADEPSILIGKMDGSENEPPHENFKWQSFPTLWYIKKGSRHPVTFNGNRTVEGLLNFVKQQATFKFAEKDVLKSQKIESSNTVQKDCGNSESGTSKTECGYRETTGKTNKERDEL